MTLITNGGFPPASGLYDPANEKDACGVGFICDIKGRPSHQIVADAAFMNCCMEHRGGVGYETNTGDGAGILTGLPHKLLEHIAREELGVTLPATGDYGVGNVFLPVDEDERARCKAVFEEQIAAAGQTLIGWRQLPVDPDIADLGRAARAAMPAFEQLFIAANGVSGDDFERKLYLIRKHTTHLLRGDQSLSQRKMMYVCSLSTKVIVYKGMLTPAQLFPFYLDLQNEAYESHLAMVHSRFSTNTFPSWDRAQPNRFMSHNGEINTLLGNVNSMNAREGVASSDLFGDDLSKLFPIAEPDCSDSGSFDNVLEFLLMSGRKLQEAVLMMIPEAWQQHQTMSSDKKAFYEYNSSFMEPWDGPASIAFTDGTYIGAVLDRNGLRPSRYYITDDDKCIMASEVGVVPVAPERVVSKGRLQPGKIFLIDFEQGRMIPDEELKTDLANRRPYQSWLDEQRLALEEIPLVVGEGLSRASLTQRMQAFGYTQETMQFMLLPMISELRDPLGSMGNDAALAVMTEKPRMLYDYFKQRFAQVTNPAIDSIREEVIMALECYIGPEKNLLETTPEHAHRLHVPHPILSNSELASLKHMDYRGWRSRTIDITYPADSGEAGLIEALDRVNAEVKSTHRGCLSLLCWRSAACINIWYRPTRDRVLVLCWKAVKPVKFTTIACWRAMGLMRLTPTLPSKRSGMPVIRGTLITLTTFTTMKTSSLRIKKRLPKACSKSWLKWVFPPCSLIKAHKSSKPSAWQVPLLPRLSRAQRAALKVSASTSSARKWKSVMPSVFPHATLCR